MTGLFSLLCAAALGADSVETRMTQSAPDTGAALARTAGQKRAVVLIHGLRQHGRDGDKIPQALTRDWQEAGSPLVKEAAAAADVFAFCYGQNVSLERVAAGAGLTESVGRLKKMGYAEIVLVGHSAGGLIARQFAEDNPACGVTKVVQVCSPNAGATKLTVGVPAGQRAFVDSLLPATREKWLKDRPGKKVPETVEFVCVMGRVKLLPGDGVVPVGSQWPADLQDQGVPVVVVEASHLNVISLTAATERIAEVIDKPQPRWPQEKVTEVRRLIYAKDPGKGKKE